MRREEMLKRLGAGEDPLELSIEKWYDIREHLQRINSFEEYDDTLERGSLNCALCIFFRSCLECPVVTKNGKRLEYVRCKGTPYSAFRIAVSCQDLDAMRKAADKEIEFLESLRGDGRK